MSWETLRQVVEAGREAAKEEKARPPVACPNDGTPFEDGPRGELHCRFCGYTADRAGNY